nr:MULTISPECIES: hypothetical protein [unclassified Streptomyces]
MEAEEIEALLTPSEAGDAGFLGVQSHPELFQYPRRQLPGRLGPLSGRRQDHEVVAAPHQHSQPATFVLPRLVEDVQGDVGQQRGDR